MSRLGVALTTAICAAAAIAIAVPLLVSGRGEDPTGPSAATAAATAAPSTPNGTAGSIDLYALPPRGSLSTDGAVVAKVRSLPWMYPGADSTATVSSPVTARRTVLFVGHVPGGVAAYVAGPVGGKLVGAWFAGPAVDSMVTISVVPVRDRTTPVSLLSRRSGLLLVVAAPGDTAQLSAAPTMDSTGHPHRTYRSLPMRDGIAAATSPARTGDAASLRILRGSAVAFRGALPPSGEVFDAQLEAMPVVRFVRATTGTSSALAQPATDQIGRDVAARLGLSTGQIDLTVLWAGELRGVPGAVASVVAVQLTLPSGATVLGVQAIAAPVGSDTGTSTLCAQTSSPAAAPDRLVLVARCDLGLAAAAPVLVVIAPAAAVNALVLDASGTVLSRFGLDHGIGSAPATAGVSVQVRSGSGTPVGNAAVLGPPLLDIGDAGPTTFT